MKRLGLALLAITAIASTSARSAHADEPAPEPRPFGTRGQLLVDVDRLLPLIGYTSQRLEVVTPDVTTSTTDRGVSFALFVGSEPSLSAMHTVPRLAADYVIAPNVTVGTALVLAAGIGGSRKEVRQATGEPATVRDTDRDTPTLVGFAPRAGYIVPLGQIGASRFSFWARGGFAYYSIRARREAVSNTGVTSTASVTDSLLSIDLDPEVVWMPLPHVMVHGGLLCNVPVVGTHDTSFEQAAIEKSRSDDLAVFHFGVSLGAGFWFDL